MFCRYCGWFGPIEQVKKREEEHYGRPWIIFSCPRCGADIAYSFKEDVPKTMIIKYTNVDPPPDEEYFWSEFVTDECDLEAVNFIVWLCSEQGWFDTEKYAAATNTLWIKISLK